MTPNKALHRTAIPLRYGDAGEAGVIQPCRLPGSGRDIRMNRYKERDHVNDSHCAHKWRILRDGLPAS